MGCSSTKSNNNKNQNIMVRESTHFVNTVNQFKVVLLGETGAGKTALFQRIMDNGFTDSYEPTVGAFFGTKIVHYGSNEYKLGIWDTAGQEKISFFRGNIL